MRLFRCLHPGLLTLLLLAAAAEQEPPPWEKSPFEADPKDVVAAAREVKIDPGIVVVVLFSDTKWTYQSDGRAEHRIRQVYRVLTEEAARENGVVQADYAPWYQERPAVRARVLSADGQAHPLNLDTLTDKPAGGGSPDVFSDRRSLAGPLPAMAAGAVVELEIVTRQSRPFFDRGVVTYHNFGAGVPCRHERLTLDAPDSLPLRHRARLLPELKTRKESAEGRSVLIFEDGPLPARPAPEPLAPSDVPPGPRIAFTSGAAWSAVAERYHETVEAQIAGADLRALGELPAKELPALERISRILALLQARVRYTSLSFGDASIVPRPPAETLKRGYGDCKDKSSLLVAALRQSGIDAHVALLLTGPGPDLEPDLPGFGAFDHAIVHVGAPDLWIDPADKLSRPGVLPIPDQDRLALIAAPGSQALVRTPAAFSRDNYDLKIREFHLAEYGPARVEETLRPTGAAERKLRGVLDQERKAVNQAFENYLSSVFMAPKLGSSSFTDAADLSKPLEVKVEGLDAGRGQTDLREAVVAVPVENLFSELPWILRGGEIKEEPGKPWRTNDLVLYQPYIMEWRYRIVPPPGFEPRTFPKADKVALGPAVLVRHFSRLEDGSVSAVFKFDCVKARLSVEEARELHAGVDRIRQEGMLLIGFASTGATHLEAGRIREALADFRKLASAHPAKALYRSQIARALLAGGLGEAARDEARKAVELEPDSLVAHQTLGWVLEHDLIGRRFEKGWDPKGAEAAFRATLRLKPGRLEETLELAIMLEHDAAGQRYSSGARLGDAVDLYKSVLKEIEGTQFENNLNIALMWAGRFAELSERLRKTSTPTGRALLLVARAALEGGDAGLAYAARSIPEDGARRASLAQAGELLVKLRFYPEAGALLAAAARGAADAATLLGRADRLIKTRRWSELPKDEGDPASALRRLVFLTVAPELDLAGLKSLMSRYVTGASKEDPSLEFRHMHTYVLESMNKQGMPPEVGRDSMLSLMELSLEGDDALGYRARIPTVFAGRGTQLWFMHKEDGRLRLLTAGDGQLGRLALDLLGAGETERARKWLEWAADELPEGAARDLPEADPFAVLWQKAKEADAGGLRRAAAALASEGAGCGAALGILEEARKEEGDAKLKYAIDHALAQGYLREKKYAEAATAAERMMSAEPEGDAAFFLRTRSLEKLRKWDDVVALCDEQLRRRPKSLGALHALQHVEMMRGRPAASQEQGRKMIKMGQADPGVYNNLAWAALLEGNAAEPALQDAQKSVMNSQGRSGSYLHTLATVYADLGRPVEARNVLLQTFQTRLTAEPEPEDWYVLGRIAEEYGALDAAAAAYRRTASAEGADLPNSTNQLSLRRLKKLEKRE